LFSVSNSRRIRRAASSGESRGASCSASRTVSPRSSTRKRRCCQSGVFVRRSRLMIALRISAGIPGPAPLAVPMPRTTNGRNRDHEMRDPSPEGRGRVERKPVRSGNRFGGKGIMVHSRAQVRAGRGPRAITIVRIPGKKAWHFAMRRKGSRIIPRPLPAHGSVAVIEPMSSQNPETIVRPFLRIVSFATRTGAEES